MLHYASLVRVGVLLTSQREQAEDLVQEAFTRAATALDRLPDDEVRPYLRRAVLNLWLNRLRRLRLERRHPIDEMPRNGVSFEERDLLWEAVSKLAPRQRACLVLRYYEDLSEPETAQVLGCSVGTVKSQTHKALARLRLEVTDGD